MPQNHSASGDIVTIDETLFKSRVDCVITGCSKTFRRAYDMDRHCGSVHDGLREQCPVCGKVLYRKDKVRAHLREEHPQHPKALSSKHYLDQQCPTQLFHTEHFPAQHLVADNPLSLPSSIAFTTLPNVTTELSTQHFAKQNPAQDINAKLDELQPGLFAEENRAQDINAELDRLPHGLLAEQYPAQNINAEPDGLHYQFFAEQDPAQDINAELDELLPQLFADQYHAQNINAERNDFSQIFLV